MSSFSRSALEMLQAAEEALTQPRATRSTRRLPTTTAAGASNAYHYKEKFDYGDVQSPYGIHCDPNSNHDDYVAPSEASTVRELQSQLSRTMRELIELRAELAAERDRRHETLLALGRQWKEEILVDVHRRDSALHADVAELEEKMAAQWKEGNESRLVVRRQLEEAVRAAKVRDTDRFQLREELQETTRHVEERLELALTQSTAARADCSRQLEQERANLSQRVDAELLRLVEMRRDDQRALQAATEAVRQDGQRMREEVRRAVQEVWETSAAALVKTATEPVEQLRAELRQCRSAVQGAEDKVADCVRTCQAECRLHTTTTVERLHALEASAAAATSRVDRAERKADGAFEVAGRMEAAVQAAKDATERAVLQAAAAQERAQKVDHALTDRDARLVAVEAHLHGVASAEGLKAEVEACKRQASRLESRMEATAGMCERVEQVADKTLRQVTDFADRIGSCEKTSQRCSEAVQSVQEAMAACQADCQQLRGRHEASEGVVQRHTQLMTQLEQRIVGQENRLGLWRQQQEQHVRDQQTVQREMTERSEVTHAMATRAQQVSSDARSEVSRLERRFDDVDRALNAGNTESAALRASLESQRTQALEAQRQQQQLEDQIRAVDARAQDRMAPFADLERSVAQRCERIETHAERLVQKVAQCEKQLQEMGTRVQDYLKDAIRHHVGESQRRLLSALNEGIGRLSDRVSAVEGSVTEVQAQSSGTPQQLNALQESCSTAQRSVQGLEGRVQTLRSHVEQLSLHAEAQSSDHQQLATVQQDVTRLVALQQRLQQDVAELQELMRALREAQLSATATAAPPAPAATRDQTLSQLGGSQAATTSTEMARTNEADSSSPSAHIPTGVASRRTSLPTANTTGTNITLPVEGSGGAPQQRKTAAVAPPLATSATTPQAQQDERRASSHSTSGGSRSKEGSAERPPSQLSGVSSVRATEEEVAHLHSLADGGLRSDSDDEAPAQRSRQGRQTVTFPSTRPLGTSLVADTTEQLTAPVVPPSAQASALANTSHPTVIRGFTTIASSSSDSDDDDDASADSSQHRRVNSHVQHGAATAGATAAAHPSRSRVAEVNTDDVSSDLTTAITLTSDAAATPSRSGGNAAHGGLTNRRARPATAQRRSVTMTAAWGQESSESSLDNTPVAATRAAPTSAAAPAPVQPQRTDVAARGSTAPAGAAGAVEDSDSDVVQAIGDGDSASDEDEVQQLPAASAVQNNAWSTAETRQQPQEHHHHHEEEEEEEEEEQRTAATDDSAPAPMHPEWDDWDEEESGSEADSPLPAQAHEEHQSDDSDMVMPLDDVEEIDAGPLQAEQRADSDASDVSSTAASSRAPSGMAATTVHHRSAAAAPTAREMRPTERRTFVAAGHSPEPRHVVPRHGQNTTSSSSSSAERAEALGLRPAAVAATSQASRPTPQVRNYTNFDDSTTSDDD